ncbi:MAG: preprotein translocase subunit YajC [Bacteroidales bacterium]|jgi:preprotein translocase subunit YajC|nr:preprotein translocase subunit YajC [Bacteroidales bacterium]
MSLTNLLLMAGGNSQQGGGGMNGIIMIVAIIVIFYFFMIRPQRKRQKEEKLFRENLQKGQKIITIGGLHGKICDVKENTVIIEIANEVRVEVEKASITINIAAKVEDKK